MLSNRSIPPCTVIPVLAYDDVHAAVTWLTRAFGFAERLRIGDHRSQMSYGDGAVVVAARIPQGQDILYEHTSQDHSVMVRVRDADAHCERARKHGARILQEPTTFPYGERQYSALDLGGHRWTFSQSVADVDPADWGGVVIDDEERG